MDQKKLARQLDELGITSIGLGVVVLLFRWLGWTLEPFYLIGIGVVELMLAHLLHNSD